MVLVAVATIASGCSQVPSYSNLSALEFESFGDQAESNGQTESSGQARDNGSTTEEQLSKFENDPESAASQFARARQLEKDGPIEDAIQEYKRLTREFSSEAVPYHRLAVMYDLNGQSEKSARHYLTAMHLAPNDNGILCDYGYSRYLQDDLHLAESTLREVIAREPEMERAHNNLALVLARQGKDQDAIEAFQDAGASLAQAQENLDHARRANKLSLASTTKKKSAS